MKRYILIIMLLGAFVYASISFAQDTEPVTSPAITPVSVQLSTLVAVGDLNFADGIGAKIIANPNYPWAGVKDVILAANVLVGNLEVPLSNRGAIYTEKTWILRADPRTVSALVSGGFDVVTLANNHMMDYGPQALLDTLNVLDDKRIGHTGGGMNLNQARQAAFITAADGTRFAFLGYSLTYPEIFWANNNRPGTAFGSPAYFINDIKQAKAMADHVVVSFHWSDEMHYYPSDYQKQYGRQCIDAGASLVLGHHPHVLQGLEVYKNGLIAYSLGNFAFGSLSNKVKDSVILAIDYDQSGLIQAKLYPVNINNYEVNFQTRLRHGIDAERVLQDLRTFSQAFKTKIVSQGEVGVIKIRQ